MEKDSERGKYASPEGSKTWEYLCAMFGALGLFIIGNMMGWNSTSLAEFRRPDSRIRMSADEASTLVASLSFGHMVSSVLGIFLVDRFGRRKCILGASVPVLISWGMIIVAEHVMVLIAARLMAGCAMGVMLTASSIYMSEILSTNIRGALSATNMVTFPLGILFMFALGPHLGARPMAGICLAISMIYLICFYLAPESPYFFLMVDRKDEAEAALEKLRGKSEVAEELELIGETVRAKGKSLTGWSVEEKDTRKHNALKLLFTIRGNLKALFIGLLLTTVQHLSGQPTITNYCHLILRAIGSEVDIYWASLLICLLQVVAGMIAVVIVDKAGRRPLYFASAATTIVLLCLVATYFFLMEHTDIEVKRYSIIPLFCLFGLVLTVMTGVGAVTMVLASEIFATDVKLLGLCIVNVIGALIGVLSSKYYLVMADSPTFGHSVPFAFYAITTTLCGVILLRWLPETKGKTLLEIQQELNA